MLSYGVSCGKECVLWLHFFFSIYGFDWIYLSKKIGTKSVLQWISSLGNCPTHTSWSANLVSHSLSLHKHTYLQTLIEREKVVAFINTLVALGTAIMLSTTLIRAVHVLGGTVLDLLPGIIIVNVHLTILKASIDRPIIVTAFFITIDIDEFADFGTIFVLTLVWSVSLTVVVALTIWTREVAVGLVPLL